MPEARAAALGHPRASPTSRASRAAPRRLERVHEPRRRLARAARALRLAPRRARHGSRTRLPRARRAARSTRRTSTPPTRRSAPTTLRVLTGRSQLLPGVRSRLLYRDDFRRARRPPSRRSRAQGRIDAATMIAINARAKRTRPESGGRAPVPRRALRRRRRGADGEQRAARDRRRAAEHAPRRAVAAGRDRARASRSGSSPRAGRASAASSSAPPGCCRPSRRSRCWCHDPAARHRLAARRWWRCSSTACCRSSATRTPG